MENQQPQGETMSLDQFRQMKASGINPFEQGETDAASQTQGEVTEDVHAEPETDYTEEETEASDAPLDASNDDEDIEVPENQKTAFQKALEREKRKAREAAEAKYKQEYEAQYNPYKAFFDRIGITDPQQAMEALERQQLQNQAQQMAYEQGWSDQETQMWVRQQELEKKQTEMQVDLQLYQLEETKKYPGIRQMKGEITAFIRQNPRATAEQAYFAVGGANLLQQMKREAEQREIAKRAKPKLTQAPDAPFDTRGPEPLPPEAVQFMRKTGMTEQQVRMMMQDSEKMNLETYRKNFKRKG